MAVYDKMKAGYNKMMARYDTITTGYNSLSASKAWRCTGMSWFGMIQRKLGMIKRSLKEKKNILLNDGLCYVATLSAVHNAMIASYNYSYNFYHTPLCV